MGDRGKPNANVVWARFQSTLGTYEISLSVILILHSSSLLSTVLNSTSTWDQRSFRVTQSWIIIQNPILSTKTIQNRGIILNNTPGEVLERSCPTQP